MANGGEPGVSHPDGSPRWLKDLWRDHPGLVLAAITVAAVAVSVALIWPITDLIAAHDVGLITGPLREARLQTAREAVRTQLLTLGAGVLAAGALIFTARNFTLSRRTVELTRQTFELTEQGQVTDRYTKAIEQLGADKLDVRIGGIYALERIARDSARDHPTVMAVLAAFIREHSREQLPKPGDDMPPRKTRPDVQTAVTVIGRRDNTRDVEPISLRGANLTGADLSLANLTDADLLYADLIEANLTEANLTSATRIGANLTDADLSDADLTRADLPDATLTRADLAGANLTSADLTSATLVRATLPGADLADADLTRADLTGADLTEADLTGADLTEAKLSPEAPIPDGWVRDPGSGLLKRASEEPGSAPGNES